MVQVTVCLRQCMNHVILIIVNRHANSVDVVFAHAGRGFLANLIISAHAHRTGSRGESAANQSATLMCDVDMIRSVSAFILSSALTPNRKPGALGILHSLHPSLKRHLTVQRRARSSACGLACTVVACAGARVDGPMTQRHGQECQTLTLSAAH